MIVTETNTAVSYFPVSKPAAAAQPKPIHLVRPAGLSAVDAAINKHYPALRGSVHAALAVFGSMSLQGRTKPLSVIFEAPSGHGKTAVLQMAFPLAKSGIENYVYRSDKFTPKSFVSHAASVKEAELGKIDLLPRLENKVLITKELAPLFRGREEEMQENFSMLISVLDGKGFTSDTGMRGKRGYERPILFNWLGATTPLPARTHRMMSQLGTRLLFYEVPTAEPTEEELLKYAVTGDAGKAEQACQKAVNTFLGEFFTGHPVGSVNPKDRLTFSEDLLRQVVRWAQFLVSARAEVKCDKTEGAEWIPIVAAPPEAPWKVINYFKELAMGHALINNRTEVDDSDLELVARVATSSVPGHLRPIIRDLWHQDEVNSGRAQALCGVTRPSARRYLKELSLLGIAKHIDGSPATNEPDRIILSDRFAWLRP